MGKKKVEPLFLFEFRKIKKKSKIMEMSFSGNKKNRIDTALDKALDKPRRKKK